MARLLILLLLIPLSFDSSAQNMGGTLKRIADARVINIGHRTDSAPFSFLDKDRQPSGYSIDLCKRVVASLQQQMKLAALEIRWVPVTADSRIPDVLKGKVDLECGTTTASLSRQSSVDFSNLIFVDGGGILLRNDSPVKTLGDLAGKKIAVTSGPSTASSSPA